MKDANIEYGKWIKRALKLVDKDCEIIADLGAGTGQIHSILFGTFPKLKTIYAIEPNEEKREKIRSAIPIDSTFDDFSLPQKVDLVLFSSSFHHCPDVNLSRLFENIKKISTSKTQILFVNEFYINWLWILRRIFGCLRMGNINVFAPVDGNHFRTKRRITKILKDNGFHEIKFYIEKFKMISLTYGPHSLWNGLGWRFYYSCITK